jgi:hypothetical protein
LALLQQMLLQCQASYLWKPAQRKFHEGDYENALWDFYRLLWLDPGATEAELNLEIVRFHLVTKDPATNTESILPSVATLGLDQMDTVIYNNQGNVRLSQQDFQGAIADYTAAIDL